jgi:alpha-tubulin suppressor-like RCC1 family protein
LRVAVVANDSFGNALDGWKAGFSTSDANVATISSTGLLIAINSGSVRITADVEGVTGSITYTITAGAPSTTFKKVAAGRDHTCAIASGGKLPDGTIACWGSGSSGQLGVGSTPFSSEPVALTAGTSFSTVAAGSHHTCALSVAGDAWCWGSETAGELGDGMMGSQRQTPVRVVTQLKFTGIALGDGHSCALTTDGLAYCWGYMKGRSSLLPDRVEGIPKLKQLVSEGGMACGLSETGSVYCWGQTDVVGSLITRENPALIGGGITFASISAGVYHSCGITQQGAGYCWGFNQQYQMGTTASQRVIAPVALPGGFAFESITAGGFTTCGITASGAQCIGMSQLQGSQATPATFVQVPRESEHRFVAISGGGNHTCAIDVRGGVWCWGNNNQYQAGIAEQMILSEPLQIRIN